MAIAIRRMTQQEFAVFRDWSIAQHTAELLAQTSMSQAEAAKEALSEFTGMLPEGLSTKEQHSLSIIEDSSGECLGFLWALYEETEGRKQSFLCDFALWEANRRQGYGYAALKLWEKQAVADGCAECVLFVADQNLAARSLYEKCGYVVLRPKDYGAYMIKKMDER